MMMTVVKTEKGFQIKSEDGELLPKVYTSKEDAEKRIGQMKSFKKAKESDSHFASKHNGTFRITMPLTVQESDAKKGTVIVGGTLLTPGKSRNGVLYSSGNVQENDAKTVKFFMQEHGDLAVGNIVGKVALTQENDVLKYHGTLRNTTNHPDVVEHATNEEIEVSLDARYKERDFSESDDAFKIEGLDIRAVCGVGIGGIPENSMDYAIAESFKLNDEMEELKTNEKHMIKEEDKMTDEKVVKENEELKKKLKEAEETIKESEEAKKTSKVAEILKLNKNLKESELMGKSEETLNVIKEYEEKKVKEQEGEKKEDEEEGDASAEDKEGEEKKDEDEKKSGDAVVEKPKEESAPVEEKDFAKNVVVEKETGTIGPNKALYRKFQSDLEKSVYR